MTEHAECAKLIRKDLKQSFPQIKFSVTSRSFAGGDAVDINWTDGPSTEQVDEVIKRYEYGKFDGMQDLYEYTNVDKSIPQVKFVMTKRELSEHIIRQFAEQTKRDFNIDYPTDDLSRSFNFNGHYASWWQLTYRGLYKTDLTGGLPKDE